MPSRRIIKKRTTPARDVDPQWTRWMRMVRELPEIRAEKVRRARQAIADHTFDAEAKLDAALDRLADELKRFARGESEPDSPDTAGV